jgi:hypothetical protein
LPELYVEYGVGDAMAAIMVVVCPAHLYGKTWKAIDAMQRHNEGLLGVPGIWKVGLERSTT